MFGRLNAKLAHLKATSQRAQTDNSAGLSLASSTEPPASQVNSSAVSANTSRAASPLPLTSFQAARAAAAANHTIAKGLALSIPQSPSIPDTPTLRSYHLYVETPLENACEPILSPTEPTAPVAPPSQHQHQHQHQPQLQSQPPLAVRSLSNKRRLSSPRLESTGVFHKPKHTKVDSASGFLIEQNAHSAEASNYSTPTLPVSAHFEHAGEFSTTGDLHSQQQTQYQYQHQHQQYLYQQYPHQQYPHQQYPHQHNQQQAYSISNITHAQQSHYPNQLMSMLNQPDQAPQPLYSQPLPPPPQDFGGAQAQHALYTQPLPPVPGGMVVDSNGIVQMLGGTSAAATMAAIIGGCSSEPPSDGRTLDDFQLLHTLGTGTFGRVFLCQSKATKRFFAMKVLRKSQVVKLKQVEHINNEKNILEAARHPFIVRLECTMQNERNLYMLMEYVPGGELFSHLRRAGRFPDDVARFYAAEIVLALDYLHSMKIIWRDTKPENILLDERGHVKLTDFGFAKRVEERTWTLCGTPEYLAPEIIQSKGHGKAVDWWALGILIFEMLAGYPPFYDDNPFGIYEKILEGNLVFPVFFSPAAKDLIQRLLTPDVSKRLGNLQGDGEDVKAHAWFSMIDWQVLVQKRIPPPIVPPHRHPGDTCNFDKYPEPPQEAALEPGVDPYRHLFSTF